MSRECLIIWICNRCENTEKERFYPNLPIGWPKLPEKWMSLEVDGICEYLCPNCAVAFESFMKER